MTTNFSFRYGERKITAEDFKPGDNALVCELERGITVTAFEKKCVLIYIKEV